jgi:hypothetical protein
MAKFGIFNLEVLIQVKLSAAAMEILISQGHYDINVEIIVNTLLVNLGVAAFRQPVEQAVLAELVVVEELVE